MGYPIATFSLSSYVVARLTTCGTRVDSATREVKTVTAHNDGIKVWDGSGR